MTLTPARALAELEAQHDALRGMMDRCEELANELDAGRCGPLQLTREVARLRLAFDAHSTFEEQLLRPALRDIDAHSAARAEKMIADHVGEHRAMRTGLGAPETRELREVIEMLRAHLEAEECDLLAVRVVRDETAASSR